MRVGDFNERAEEQTQISRVEPLLTALVGASLAHEINNPLAYVLASLEFALSAGVLDHAEASEVRRAVHDALTGVEQIRGLVSDLRKLARGEPPATSAVSARPLLDLAVQQANVATRGAGATVRLGRVDDIFVRANRPLLLQAVANVLVNAVQAAAQTKGAVLMECERKGPRAVIRVLDEGPGVPESFRSHLFEPLFTTKAEGAGLGLYLARSALRAMGGELAHVPSERGALFVFELAVA
jgi:C4-dicarboxylate-specific signal transduction histidine kinase